MATVMVRSVIVAAALAQATPSPSPSPTRIVVEDATGPLETIVGLVAIALALAAGVLAYRVIRGGRGL